MTCNMQKGTFGLLRKVSSLALLYDSIRFCAEVDLLQTEKKYIKRKVLFQISLCGLRRLISETTFYVNVRKSLFVCCKSNGVPMFS